MVKGSDLAERANLDPNQINDAVELLASNGHVSVIKAFGARPFDFAGVQLTTRGRAEAERLAGSPSHVPSSDAQVKQAAPGSIDLNGSSRAPEAKISTSATPVGSPYGFTEHDWASVAVDHADRTRLVVSLGFAWQCDFYSSERLERNVKEMFVAAVDRVNTRHDVAVTLDFRKLQGGYGAHLFNEIARDIIAADITIFDSSALNANVMIELGVALTWGTVVLPIRHQSSPQPPSDISGHTWAAYDEDARIWMDPQHDEKLFRLVEMRLRRKGAIP